MISKWHALFVGTFVGIMGGMACGDDGDSSAPNWRMDSLVVEHYEERIYVGEGVIGEYDGTNQIYFVDGPPDCEIANKGALETDSSVKFFKFDLEEGDQGSFVSVGNWAGSVMLHIDSIDDSTLEGHVVPDSSSSEDTRIEGDFVAHFCD
jgi:hypothetical protein